MDDDIANAWKRISEKIPPTPLIRSEWLSKLSDADVYLKLECLNLGHSFKIRGALNSILSLDPLPNKVITASGGNHGLGVAIAAKLLGIKARIYLPVGTSGYRINILEREGAEVEIFGKSYDDAHQHALEIANRKGIPYIHAFSQREVYLGQGTLVQEIKKQIGDVDAIMASVGGGGLLSGIILTAKALRMNTKFYSVETKGADCFYRSYKTGMLLELPEITSIAKTLGARKTTEEIFEILNSGVEDAWVVSDQEAVQGLFEFLEEEKIILEPAASCLIPAFKKHAQMFSGKKVVLVICGSNVTIEQALEWKKQFLE
ncbi:MAG: pyridoxal-phosphate dependent enzyme [Methanobacteriota archaeon]|nr:MAG: pyridoxal-phosphate dependent enzyme [Euryarchaeota archaeon]